MGISCMAAGILQSKSFLWPLGKLLGQTKWELIPSLIPKFFIWFLNIAAFFSHLNSSQFESFGISIKSKREKGKTRRRGNTSQGAGQ